MSMILKLLLFAMIALGSCAAHSDADPRAALLEINGMNVTVNARPYRIQQSTSRMAFRVDSPIGDVWASFHDFAGVFTMPSDGTRRNLAAIEINADSLDTDGGFIGLLLKGRKFFDVEKFPSMHFVGRSLEWYGNRKAVLKGHLTIKGITREVAFYVELIDVDNMYSDRITVEASTTIRRSEFGIDSLLPAVSDNVNLFMSIDAVKEPEALSLRQY